mmetsp:Transcript_25373/g.22508  ORF Transcript_25373/g.22508 Transcript_25373/m.22508 type:complete len:119 (-) Transcript_25373:48-404(-)
MVINKIGGLPLYQNISIHNSISNRNGNGLRKGSPKAGISALREPARNYSNTVQETKPEGLGIYTDPPPPTKMPNLHNHNNSMLQYQASTPLGSMGGMGGLTGGGLSRASGMSLGRNQI